MRTVLGGRAYDALSPHSKLWTKAEIPWWKGMEDWDLAVVREGKNKGTKVQKIEKMDFNACDRGNHWTQRCDVTMICEKWPLKGGCSVGDYLAGETKLHLGAHLRENGWLACGKWFRTW